MDERGAVRFNMTHVPAGSATGGQFGTSSGGASAAKSGAKTPAKTPAKAAPAHHMSPAHAAEKAKLLAQAHKDAAEAAALEHQLAGLEKQAATAASAAKKSAAAAKASLKAGHVVHHRHHAAHHAAHSKHHASLKQKITTLKGKIHALRVQAASLEKQASAIRSGDNPGAAEISRESDLKYGRGSALWDYWTRGGGFAKWSGAVHKWTTLHALLLAAGVPSASADGLATNIITAVMPGYMKQAHAKAGRSAVTEPDGSWDADGLDGSWDGDHSDLPDLAGLTVADLEAADETAPPQDAAARAMPRLGTGARFARLKSSLAAKGAKDPGALAAYIGRRKFGKGKFTKLAAKARGKGGASRMAPLEYFRTYELEDIHVVRAAQGDSTGRLVEAYAAVFNSPAEIHDHEGHYVEEIDPSAFNKVVADIGRSRAGFGKVKVIFNHGLTIHGTPSERGSMPIGRAMEIRAEERGLLTLTRYSETPFADEVLENIRNGAITAQSFTGRIVRSDPELRRGEKHYPRGGQLTRVRRTELGLKEFGPTPFEAYSGAEIVGVRMSTPGTWEPDENDQQDEALPPDGEAAAGEPLTRTDGDGDEHSARYHQHALFTLRSKEARERVGLVW